MLQVNKARINLNKFGNLEMGEYVISEFECLLMFHYRNSSTRS